MGKTDSATYTHHVKQISNDNKITNVDVVKVAKYIVNAKPEKFNAKDADVNSDGKVNIFDLTLYKEYMNGSITKFPGDKS